jgi:hypothetical protein
MITHEEAAAWFAGSISKDWFTGPPEVTADDEEVLVVGTLKDVELAAGTKAEAKGAAEAARIDRFREETRNERIQIARDAERKFGLKVSWGAVCGSTRILFSTAAVPVMTRLKLADRQVLDTLVASGVARSRADALAWCVKLVAKHQSEWIGELRGALGGVEEVKKKGPAL